MTFTKSASWNGGSISTSRFTDCHQICQQVYWLSQIYQQIYWLSLNLLADLLNFMRSADRNVGGSISAGRFTESHQICWQIYCHKICQQICWLSTILSPEMRGYFCSQIYGLSPNLPADLLAVTKSADRCAEFHQICWQKCGGSISAGRFTDSQ